MLPAGGGGHVFAAAICAAAALPDVAALTFRYTALGDWGMGGYPAGNGAEILSAMCFHDVAQEFDTQFTVNVGDQLYMTDVTGGLEQSWRQTWRRPGSHGGGMWMCTRGNHDNFPPQVSYTVQDPTLWWFPAAFWTRKVDTNQGYSVQVWGLDSNGGGTDNGWLERSLRASTARWKLFTTHFPFANAGRHKRVGPPIHMANMAKQYGVQVMFQGHDHIVQVCMHQGVAFVTTGATSRGAMMARPIDGDKSKFVFTLGTKTSVGQHGITQFQMTRNVMWGSIHGHGSMVYEFQTVWDWPMVYNRNRYKPEDGSNRDSALPSRKTLMEYLLKEADEIAAGNVTTSEGVPVPQTPAPPATPAPTNKVDTSAAAERSQLEAEQHQQTEAEVSQMAEVTSTPVDPIRAARYVVASECKGCAGPSMQTPMTVWVQGLQMTPKHRIFLSFEEDACRSGDTMQAVGGPQAVVTPSGPVHRFVPEGQVNAPTPAYVCLSGDEGKSYAAIHQADSGVTAFTLFPEPPPQRPPLPGSRHTAANYGYARPGVVELTLPPAGPDTGHHAALWMMGGLLVAGLPAAWYLGRQSRDP
eukprot:TRINITY_DN46864_c0_g1_i1.p1 TRINITY_DN46864_c0_g1~~TRINITY_DN46864_c0_g1_i1.p1  ORF type:complete len:623 (+),score=170.25 TRINITY_DN46864_c0_g1_i1:124-1869(+)